MKDRKVEVKYETEFNGKHVHYDKRTVYTKLGYDPISEQMLYNSDDGFTFALDTILEAQK